MCTIHEGNYAWTNAHDLRSTVNKINRDRQEKSESSGNFEIVSLLNGSCFTSVSKQRVFFSSLAVLQNYVSFGEHTMECNPSVSNKSFPKQKIGEYIVSSSFQKHEKQAMDFHTTYVTIYLTICQFYQMPTNCNRNASQTLIKSATFSCLYYFQCDAIKILNSIIITMYHFFIA